MFCKKQYFRAIWNFAFSLAAHWAFIFCLRCHLAPILLIAAKQCWCHFEANECISHLSLNIFRSFHQLTRHLQNRAFPNLWLTLYAKVYFGLLGAHAIKLAASRYFGALFAVKNWEVFWQQQRNKKIYWEIRNRHDFWPDFSRGYPSLKELLLW